LFFQRFPNFRKNKFWISGESYAGIYVPMLADLVSNDSSINFAGMLVGNGVTDYHFDSFETALAPFAYNHGLYPTQLWDQFQQWCPTQPNSQQCQQAEASIEAVFDDINVRQKRREEKRKHSEPTHPFSLHRSMTSLPIVIINVHQCWSLETEFKENYAVLE
jgi:carboxypeptidase C (cathepsin A)